MDVKTISTMDVETISIMAETISTVEKINTMDVETIDTTDTKTISTIVEKISTMDVETIRTKPGVYVTQCDIKIKVILLCRSSTTDKYSLICDAIIPKDSTIVHKVKDVCLYILGKNDKYNTIDVTYDTCNQPLVRTLRTDSIHFGDIKKHHVDDICSFNERHRSNIENVKSNTTYKTDLDTDINSIYYQGTIDGYVFSLCEDAIKLELLKTYPS